MCGVQAGGCRADNVRVGLVGGRRERGEAEREGGGVTYYTQYLQERSV